MAKKKPTGSSKSSSKASPPRAKAKDAAPKKSKADAKQPKPRKAAAKPESKPKAPPSKRAAVDPPVEAATKPSKSKSSSKAKAAAEPAAKPAPPAAAKPEPSAKSRTRDRAKAPAPTAKDKPKAPAPPAKPAKAAAEPPARKPKAEKPAGPPQPRYRSVFDINGDQGAAAAAKLLDAMGIARPSIGDAVAPLNHDGEKRLTKSPLKKQQIKEFQDILLQKRSEIVGDVAAMESQALNSQDRSSSALSQHMADQGSDTYDQTLALDLAASQRDLLREIDAALDRIDAGTFGICEATGRAIRLERLENTPWARLSIDAARAAESMGFRR